MWLKEGDKNARFFHAQVSFRKRKNWVVGVRDTQGEWQEDGGVMEGIIKDYFKAIIHIEAKNDLQACRHVVNNVITVEMNQQLLKPYTKAEVTTTLKTNVPV